MKTEIVSSITKGGNDRLVRKSRISSFYNTQLDQILTEEDVSTLLIGGISTDLAVESATRDAHDRNFKVIVLEDLCAAANEEGQETGLKHLSKIAHISDSKSVAELN